MSFHSMSAPTNVAKTMPVTKPVPSDEEVIDIGALTQQLMNAQTKNARIEKKKKDWAAQEMKNKEGQDRRDEADRLAREAKQKTKKVNKKKRVSAILRTH